MYSYPLYLHFAEKMKDNKKQRIINMIKIGIVGTRGLSVFDAIKNNSDDAKVVAICDISEESLAFAVDYMKDDSIKTYRVYEDMLEKADIDAVVVSTPMQCHVPQAILALQAGKHVMCEVTAAVTMDELWWLIENVEKSGKIYMYAENYCYMPDLVLVREMAKAGYFGELYYGEGEYTHEISNLCTFNGKPTRRSYWQMGTRGTFFPTHSLGPIMQCFENDRIVSISSFSSGNHNSFGLRNDDVNQTFCQLESGKLVKIRVDTLSPRPHLTNYYQIQGTKGCYEAPRGLGDVAKIAIATDDDPEGFKEWKPLSDYKHLLPERYLLGEGDNAGHGGGDFYIVADFINAIKSGIQPELNVYKAAEWTSVALLSQLSVTNGNRTMDVPNFRKNMPWEEKRIKL